jgi:hypothetical protein
VIQPSFIRDKGRLDHPPKSRRHQNIVMSNPNPTAAEYWKRKLSAFLHDSPDKVLDIADHERRARTLAQPEGFQSTETARKSADFAASAADRLPWPKSRIGNAILCRSEFIPTDNALRHPLGGSSISFDRGFATADEGLVISQSTRPRIASDDPRATFISAWRFWQNWASSADERFACLPAETRLPDHTIWNHLSVTSAMQGCLGGSLQDWLDAQAENRHPTPPPDRPAFLLFSIGPVQEFIAAARNTRDLWSGSYLLSYLIGTVLSRIALDLGPDHVLFPSLTQQPIIDLLLKRDLWDHVKTAAGNDLWEAFGYYSKPGRERLLTPSLPNRFLAMLPSNMVEHPAWKGPDSNGRTGAARYAAHLEEALRKRLRKIAESVSEHCNDKLGTAFDTDRFSHQIERLLDVHWQVLPWPAEFETAARMAGNVPGEEGRHPLDSVHAIQDMLDRMPVEHRDAWNFKEQHVGVAGKASPLAQVSNAWSGLFALATWQLDALKGTRTFKAWSNGGWELGREFNKDSLNGKEEACLVVSSDDDAAKKLSRDLTGGNENAFKAGDLLGASTLVKRLWHLTWLSKEHPFEPDDFGMPNTRSIAARQPFNSDADDDSGSEADEKYFAVLALDGDEMGRWISGVKCPELRDQLSKEAREYFEQHGNTGFLKARRPLSPSFHLQFSELLANFGLHCARRIIEGFDGRLIYAGGDDVLAMLPAEAALQCARALRAAFRGDMDLADFAKGLVARSHPDRSRWRSDRSTPLFTVRHKGFVRLTPAAAPDGHGSSAGLLDEPVSFPFLVPGPAADCSVGIAIAHFKSPLQDVVRAAQAAEKRAKKALGRSAVAVTLMKRSGEIIEWGAKWKGGLELYQTVSAALENEHLSAKFPHRFAELLEAYILARTPLLERSGDIETHQEFPVADIIRREFDHCLCRQRGARFPNNSDEANTLLHSLRAALDTHLGSLSDAGTPKPESDHILHSLIGLCQTVAFAHRTSSND